MAEAKDMVFYQRNKEMKVCFTNKHRSWDAAKTGKGFFAQRLLAELNKLGVETTTDPDVRVDIDLQISHDNYMPKNARKRIVRCGPVHYDTNMDWKGHNKADWKYIKQCHGIIYQSEFSRRMQYFFVGKPKETQKTAVIYNGADIEYYKTVKPFKSPFKYNFLASTREWVWEKRLKDIIEAFKLCKVTDSCLWIAGQVWDTPKRFPAYQKDFHKKYKSDNIRFLGQCEPKIVASLYKLCNAMIHIVYCDACPNAVAEALCAGCKVITNDAGGQVELVEPVTQHVFNDVPVPSKPWDRRKVPDIDRQWIADTMESYSFARNDNWVKDCSHVNIGNIAVQYASFFKQVLNG